METTGRTLRVTFCRHYPSY